MCKKRETLLYKVSLGFNDLFFTKFKYTEFRRGYHHRYFDFAVAPDHQHYCYQLGG